MEGNRPILTEIQALVSHTPFGLPRRTVVGVDFNRVNMLLAVLEKRCGMNFGVTAFSNFVADAIGPEGLGSPFLMVKDVYGRFLLYSNFATLKPFWKRRQRGTST